MAGNIATAEPTFLAVAFLRAACRSAPVLEWGRIAFFSFSVGRCAWPLARRGLFPAAFSVLTLGCSCKETHL
jgi:hypothetical protein